MTLRILLPNIIVIALFIIIIFFIVIYLKKWQKQNAIKQCQGKISSLLSEISPTFHQEKKSSQLWADILDKKEYLNTLCSNGSMIVYGTTEMGLSTIFKKITNKINSDYDRTHRIAIYINIPDLPCTIGTIESSLPEDIYRLVLSSTINELLWNLENSIGKKIYNQSGLPALDTRLKDLLCNSIIEMPVTEIAQTFNETMALLDIKQIKICLDNITIVKPEKLPFLLSLLMRTFQSSGRMDLVFGGEMEKLQLIIDTREGPVGIQFGHDIFLGLNVNELLLPHTEDIEHISTEGSLRAHFIQHALTKINLYPEASPSSFQQYIKNVFLDSDSWITLFQFHNGDLEMIMNSLHPLLDWTRTNNTRINHDNFQEIYTQLANNS